MRSEDNSNTLIVFSSSLPVEGDTPLIVPLNDSVNVDDTTSVSINEIVFVPRLDARQLVKFLTLHFNKSEKTISFGGLTVALDDRTVGKPRQVIERLAAKTEAGIRIIDGLEPVDNTALDAADTEVEFDASLFDQWLTTKKIPVEETVSNEEQIENQILGLLGDDIFDDDDDEEQDGEEQRDTNVTVTLPEGKRIAAETDNSIVFDSSTVSENTDHADDADDEDDAPLFDTSSDLDDLIPSSETQTETQTHAEVVSDSTTATTDATTDDDAVVEDDIVAVTPQRKRESRPREDERKKPRTVDDNDTQWSDDDTRTMRALDDTMRDVRAREDEPAQKPPQRDEDVPRSRHARPSEHTAQRDSHGDRDDDDTDSALNAVAEETPAFEVSQYDMLSSRNEDEQNARLNHDAYIDTSLDADSDREVDTLHAAEATFDSNTSAPAFLERKHRENERTREFVEERLVPDPENYQDFDEIFDSVTAEELSQHGDGLPKEEAPSEAPVSWRTTAESAREGATTDINNPTDSIDDDVLFGSSDSADDVRDDVRRDEEPLPSRNIFADTEPREDAAVVGGEESVLEPVGFNSRMQRELHNTYQAVRAVRNQDTRVLSITGPSGGSGKTTTSYGLFLASGRVDHAYKNNGRGKQLTWLIELDVTNSKWKARSHLEDDLTLVGIIKEYERRNGNVSNDQLFDIALRHSADIVEGRPNSRLIAAPMSVDYLDGKLNDEKTYLVIERVIDAIVRNKEHSSTIILDFPDYAGEELDSRLSKIMNTYSDNISVCFPENGNEDDLVTILRLLRGQSRNAVEMSRVSIIGTRRTAEQAERLRNFAVSHQINYAGTTPRIAALTESETQWIAQRSPSTQNKLTLSCAQILSQTNINKMAEGWLDFIHHQMKRSPSSAKKSSSSESRGGATKSRSSGAQSKKASSSSAKKKKTTSSKSSAAKTKSKSKPQSKNKPGWKKILGLD